MRIRRVLIGAVTAALVAAGVAGVAAPASADTTVSTLSALQAAFGSATATNTNVDVVTGIAGPTSTLTLPPGAVLTLSIAGANVGVDVQNVVLGVGSTLTVTSPAANPAAGLLAFAQGTTYDAGIQTTGATLNITGDAQVGAYGGDEGAGVGGSGSSTVGGAGGTVVVSGNATLTAAGGDSQSSGIGGGASDSGASGIGGSLTVSGFATVKATGDASGVGGGLEAVGGPITIGDEASLEADSTENNGSALGSGFGFSFTDAIDTSPVVDNGVLILDHSTYNSGAISGHGVIEGDGSIDNQGTIDRHVVVDVKVSGVSHPMQFLLNDGSGESFESFRAYGPDLDSVGKALPVPTRTKWAFGGWNQLADGTGAFLDGHSSLGSFQVVYAHWLATTSKVSVSGSSFTKKAHPKVKVTVAKLSTGVYPVGTVAIDIAGLPVATGTLTLANKGVISITLPAQTKSIKVQAIYEGDANTQGRSSSIVTIKAK